MDSRANGTVPLDWYDMTAGESMSTVSRTQDALGRLAESLVVPCDIVTVHRQHSPKSRTKEFYSLRYGALLLALAAFDAFLTTSSGFGDKSGHRSVGLNPDRLRRAFHEGTGVVNITGAWHARARVAPEKLGRHHHRSPWYLFEGNELVRYLDDLQVARNILAHGGTLNGLQNKSGALHKIKGGFSIRLMTVEGTIQAIEDIASQTALVVGVPRAAIPKWPSPQSTKFADTGRLPVPY